MTELAYMIREDWAQHATTMVSQSAVIRDWLGAPPYVFAMKDVRDFSLDGRRDADFETAKYIAPDSASPKVASIQQLGRFVDDDKTLRTAMVVLHPFEDDDVEALAHAVKRGSLDRVFVMIWSPRDMVRSWLDGLGAVNLHTGAALEPPDPLMLEAGKSMVGEEYNGLASGNGKDAVVQLVRAFAAEGYPLEVAPWLRAYFAAGGSVRHAKEIEKLIGEMKKGVTHRVKQRYVPNTVQVLKDHVTSEADQDVRS